MRLADTTTAGGAKDPWAGVWRQKPCVPPDASPTTESNAHGPESHWGRVKVAARRRRACPTASLKPYRGKPAVRNFRGSRGNAVDGLVTICHDARKGRYIGSHWPNHGAPLLYSTIFMFGTRGPTTNPHQGRRMGCNHRENGVWELPKGNREIHQEHESQGGNIAR
jgi:hypothetical protein